jgi:hypothetical protein
VLPQLLFGLILIPLGARDDFEIMRLIESSLMDGAIALDCGGNQFHEFW